MASTEAQKPLCPVCHKADQVKTMQAAYDSGVGKCAPPDMPTKSISMMPYIIFCGILVGIFIFLVIVLIGSEAELSPVFQFILVALTLISVVAALVISYMAFQRVVKGDAEATERFPVWDRAMTAWRDFYYCSRDDIVFDPKKNSKIVSNDELAALRAMEPGTAGQVAQTLVQK